MNALVVAAAGTALAERAAPEAVVKVVGAEVTSPFTIGEGVEMVHRAGEL